MILYACVNVCICMCMRACVRAYVRACVCACVSACVRACVCACVRVVCGHVGTDVYTGTLRLYTLHTLNTQCGIAILVEDPRLLALTHMLMNNTHTELTSTSIIDDGKYRSTTMVSIDLQPW